MLSSFDKNGDGYIDDAEASDVQEININGAGGVYIEGLNTIKGVETFINLKHLTCVGTKGAEGASGALFEIDVTKLKKMEYLACSGNNLSQIDLSNNLQLKHLEITHNELSRLDLSSNPELIRLYCNHNKVLTQINISQNANLEELFCQNNMLSVLDISNNRKLIHIDCRKNGDPLRIITWDGFDREWNLFDAYASYHYYKD